MILRNIFSFNCQFQRFHTISYKKLKRSQPIVPFKIFLTQQRIKNLKCFRASRCLHDVMKILSDFVVIKLGRNQ